MSGAPIVYTINSDMIGDFLKLYEDEPIEDNRGKNVPDDILAELIRIPYFRQGYSAHGMTADEFINHPASVYTANGFSNDMHLLEEFVEKGMIGITQTEK